MKSWANWSELSINNINAIPKKVNGVYIIRKTKNIALEDSDIIYIGCSKNLKTRLRDLLNERDNHYESKK